MTKGYFDAPVFEIEKCEIDVDISTTPFFFNDNGNPAYLKVPSHAQEFTLKMNRGWTT